MHRIDSSTATPDNRFTEGDPTIPVPATTVTADWLNAMQEEAIAVLVAAGIAPDKANNAQMLAAILRLIANSTPLAKVGTPGLVMPDGTTITVDATGKISADNTLLDAWRKTWIGVPRSWRSTTLPENHCWANGDFIAFSDWPELLEIYTAGGISGLLLAYDANAATIAANLGKWRPDSANPTGLYTPNLCDQFSRAWGPGSARQAGAWWDSQNRAHTHGYGAQWPGSGYMTSSGDSNRLDSAGAYATSSSGGTEAWPKHVMEPTILYLGRPAQI